ncbi:YicC/YloC family endoribonuclease [Nonlabens tegetincola]|uniref:YicC/YloC family endoribonuclease n=1 Tax=Nonlabens tegetincola TaxID=323273 RepID=UPI000CF48FF1|nr:YicC/YloC family endoribonuclease [Nonlabens tegetincola]PQJ20226.1 YicC family protein [Nonlabens tegetincola]
MIISMTGYGKAVTQLSDKKITVEIRTLNSKNLDLNLRMSNAYRETELDLRKNAAKILKRGKVDFSLHVEDSGAASIPALNIEVIDTYLKQLEQIELVKATSTNHKIDLLKVISQFPDIFKPQDDDLSDEVKETIFSTAQEAIEAAMEFRKSEGNQLEFDFNSRISTLTNLLNEVITIDEERLKDVRVRLEKAVKEVKEEVDSNRFEQELIYYLEKYDITEEKVRLKNHLNYFVETMKQPVSQGKKLGFISQEIGREINTIGSKANHAPMQKLVVQMKDELEKIKEQLLNVL